MYSLSPSLPTGLPRRLHVSRAPYDPVCFVTVVPRVFEQVDHVLLGRGLQHRDGLAREDILLLTAMMPGYQVLWYLTYGHLAVW